MKKSSVLLLLMALINFSFAQKIEYKIYPVDETKNDTTITQFIEVLEEVISAKDTFRLYKMLDKNIVSSFGGGIYGKQGFIENWYLETPESSLVWKTMKRIIEMGCVAENGRVNGTTVDSVIFHFPYANANKLFDPLQKKNPEYDFNPYSTIICVKENIPIYKNPNNKSVIVDYLSYDVVIMDYGKSKKQNLISSNNSWKWIYITTIDQSISGWVLNNDDIYFLGDYSLILEKVNNEYKITGFFPFD
jgi:hypothetical protein